MKTTTLNRIKKRFSEQTPEQFIVSTIYSHLPSMEKKVIIHLFGSRASGKATSQSDYDIALESFSPISPQVKRHIATDFTESPYRIDLIDLSRVTKEFRDEVLRTSRELR